MSTKKFTVLRLGEQKNYIHTVVVLIDLLLAPAPLSGQPSMPPTAEQPGPGCTWFVQKVPCALHALYAHEDTTRQEPRQATLLLAQALRMYLPPMVRYQGVEETGDTRMHRCGVRAP